MDDVKPPEKAYEEGEQAARQFEGLVKRAVTVSPAEVKKRQDRWEKEKKVPHKKSKK
jgi:membrane-bound lytic murein transglycosylase MltF